MFKRLAAMTAGIMLVLTAGTSLAQTVSTPTPSNNGAGGIMFDVTATNAVTVTGLASQFSVGTRTVNIYTRPGTHVGFSNASAGWSLVGTTSLTGTGAVQSIPVVLSEPIAAGQTKGFYIAQASSSGIKYRDGTAVGAVAASDANIQILEGTGKPMLEFDPSSNFTPRVLVGSVTYSAAPAPVPTLSEWAMILLGLILAGGAALYIQRRQLIA